MFAYLCLDCGAVMEDLRNDVHIYKRCPYCEGNIEPAEPCQVCGALFPRCQEAHHLCQAHKKDALEKFRAFLSSLSDGEIAYLQDKMDGVYWYEVVQ